jgi:CDGSH-type Zn-finger protein
MTKITCNNDGSVKIESEDLQMFDSTGAQFDLAGRTTIGLCRCGASENKPFCDGSHKRIGFKSEIKARALPPPAPKPVMPQV